MSKKHLAEDLDLSERTVFDILETLKEKDLIDKNQLGHIRTKDTWNELMANSHDYYIAFNGKESQFVSGRPVEPQTAKIADPSAKNAEGMQKVHSTYAETADEGMQKLQTDYAESSYNNNTTIINNNNSNNTTRSRSQAEFAKDSEEYRLSELLYQNILSFNDRFKKPDLQKWCAEVDKMLRIDGRSIEEVEALILWVSQDSFWKANILSTRKLREKFDQLWSKAVANQQSKARPHLIID